MVMSKEMCVERKFFDFNLFTGTTLKVFAAENFVTARVTVSYTKPYTFVVDYENLVE